MTTRKKTDLENALAELEVQIQMQKAKISREQGKLDGMMAAFDSLAKAAEKQNKAKTQKKVAAFPGALKE